MIVVKLMGGLGNQMFQYALGRHLAYINNTELKLDLSFLLDRTPRENFIFRDYDLDIFNIRESIATPKDLEPFFSKPSTFKKIIHKISPSVYQLVKESYFHFNPDMLKQSDNSYLEGYWQSEQYFKNIEVGIRKEFTFKYDLPIQYQEIAKAIKAADAVCVHVRRTDFVDNPYHEICGIEYYRKAESLLSEKSDRLHAFIFSDDIDWCIQNLKLKIPSTFIAHAFEGKEIAHCLHLMSMCKYFIVPNSTFSWWAAWLNPEKEKMVIAPKRWLNDETVNTKDIIPSDWITI